MLTERQKLHKSSHLVIYASGISSILRLRKQSHHMVHFVVVVDILIKIYFFQLL